MHMSYFGDSWYLSLRFWMTSPLGFKTRVGCPICIVSSLRSTSGATPADLFDSQLAASAVPHIPLPVGVRLLGLKTMT